MVTFMFTSYVKVWGTIIRFRCNYEPADWLIGPQNPSLSMAIIILGELYINCSPKKKSLYPEHLLKLLTKQSFAVSQYRKLLCS